MSSVRIAYTIGAYRLVSFIKLSILQLRKLDPDCSILISDDPSGESPHIQNLAKETGCEYRGARVRRGHFAADFQSLVNALVFAEACGANVAVKVSQRFIFRRPESVDVIRRAFENSHIMAATPGQPKVVNGSQPAQGFGAFGTLSDIVAMRVGALSAEQLLHLYRARIIREKVPWASFIECLVDELHSNVFPGKTMKLQELTNPTRDPIYLRRYQATEKDYRDLALSHGFNGLFPIGEWGHIENQNYMCRPVVI
jgi:hypothetical protein